MIKYKLECNDCEIIFDSWFASSKEYDKLKKNNFLICHNCNSKKIEKTLMAPQLINSKKKSKDILDSAKYSDIKKTMKNYQKFIKNNFKYVGENFAYEARSIHYDEKKRTKGIYGNASKEDIKELKDEGIETKMLPWIEDEDN
jgi:hypothetical protein